MLYLENDHLGSSVKNGLILRSSFRGRQTTRETFFNNPDEKNEVLTEIVTIIQKREETNRAIKKMLIPVV